MFVAKSLHKTLLIAENKIENNISTFEQRETDKSDVNT